MKWHAIVVEAVWLLLIAAAVGTIANVIAPETRKLAWLDTYESPVPMTSVPAAKQASGSPHGEPASEDLQALAPQKDPGLPYLEISGEDAQRLQRAGAVFIDARRTNAFESGHIPGARNIAVWEHDAQAKVDALHGAGLPFDQVIVVYCSGRGCEDSAMLAEKLSGAGFYSVYVYRDGLPDWQARGNPVRQGRDS